jgi:hypothetical protein
MNNKTKEKIRRKRELVRKLIILSLKETNDKDYFLNSTIRIYNKFKMSRKDRKHSGRITAYNFRQRTNNIEDMVEPVIYYDDWDNYRDGFRFNKDRKHLFKKGNHFCLSEEQVEKINKKIKKQIIIRKIKRYKKKEMDDWRIERQSYGLGPYILPLYESSFNIS